jgi:hypothetical protein
MRGERQSAHVEPNKMYESKYILQEKQVNHQRGSESIQINPHLKDSFHSNTSLSGGKSFLHNRKQSKGAAPPSNPKIMTTHINFSVKPQ